MPIKYTLLKNDDDDDDDGGGGGGRGGGEKYLVYHCLEFLVREKCYTKENGNNQIHPDLRVLHTTMSRVFSNDLNLE